MDNIQNTSNPIQSDVEHNSATISKVFNTKDFVGKLLRPVLKTWQKFSRPIRVLVTSGISFFFAFLVHEGVMESFEKLLHSQAEAGVAARPLDFVHPVSVILWWSSAILPFLLGYISAHCIIHYLLMEFGPYWRVIHHLVNPPSGTPDEPTSNMLLNIEEVLRHDDALPNGLLVRLAGGAPTHLSENVIRNVEFVIKDESLPNDMLSLLGGLHKAGVDPAGRSAVLAVVKIACHFFAADPRQWNEIETRLAAIRNDLENAPTIGSHFTNQLLSLQQVITKLARGDVVESQTRKYQFDVAGSIAQYYSDPQHPERKVTFTARATSLDTPSEFKGDYGREYFDYFLKNLPSGDASVFLRMALDEKDALLSQLDSDRPRENPQTAIPAKARIVVLKKSRLLGEITKLAKDNQTFGESQFAQFVQWHLQNRWGLKFLVTAEDVDPENPYNIKDDEIRTRIRDFIVYNGETVFGRVNPNPTQSNVMLKLLTSTSDGPVPLKMEVMWYEQMFQELWQKPQCYTLSQICLKSFDQEVEPGCARRL